MAAFERTTPIPSTGCGGTVGLGYNKRKVAEALGVEKIDSWDAFFDPEKVAKLAECGVYASILLPT